MVKGGGQHINLNFSCMEEASVRIFTANICYILKHCSPLMLSAWIVSHNDVVLVWGCFFWIFPQNTFSSLYWRCSRRSHKSRWLRGQGGSSRTCHYSSWISNISGNGALLLHIYKPQRRTTQSIKLKLESLVPARNGQIRSKWIHEQDYRNKTKLSGRD